MEFQITQEDVLNVLNSYQVTGFDIEEVMVIIDDDQVSSAALSADIDDDDETTLENQTQVAYDEIAKQLFDAGYITKEQVKKFGNTAILA